MKLFLASPHTLQGLSKVLKRMKNYLGAII